MKNEWNGMEWRGTGMEWNGMDGMDGMEWNRKRQFPLVNVVRYSRMFFIADGRISR